MFQKFKPRFGAVGKNALSHSSKTDRGVKKRSTRLSKRIPDSPILPLNGSRARHLCCKISSLANEEIFIWKNSSDLDLGDAGTRMPSGACGETSHPFGHSHHLPLSLLPAFPLSF